jgi:hypothetical protein
MTNVPQYDPEEFEASKRGCLALFSLTHWPIKGRIVHIACRSDV